MKEELTALLHQSLETLTADGVLPDASQAQIKIDRTRDKSHGDLATNLALTLAKPAGKNPRELAQLICDALPASALVARTDRKSAG